MASGSSRCSWRKMTSGLSVSEAQALTCSQPVPHPPMLDVVYRNLRGWWVLAGAGPGWRASPMRSPARRLIKGQLSESISMRRGAWAGLGSEEEAGRPCQSGISSVGRSAVSGKKSSSEGLAPGVGQCRPLLSTEHSPMTPTPLGDP
eukprot:4161847-Amphidinium_carterae.3